MRDGIQYGEGLTSCMIQNLLAACAVGITLYVHHVPYTTRQLAIQYQHQHTTEPRRSTSPSPHKTQIIMYRQLTSILPISYLH
jgi:hypothetical protein